MDKRIFVEKKADFRVKSDSLVKELQHNLQLKTLKDLRIVQVYDVFGLAEDLFARAEKHIFSEQVTDTVLDEAAVKADLEKYAFFAIESLPGQFDQRAASSQEALLLLGSSNDVTVNTAQLYLVNKDIDANELEAVKNYLLNPVDSRFKDITVGIAKQDFSESDKTIPSLDFFETYTAEDFAQYKAEQGLAMEVDDLLFIQDYFKSIGRVPTETELKVLDTYWSDHCRHTTFETELKNIDFSASKFEKQLQATYDKYIAMRDELGRTEKPQTLMDMATIFGRYERANGRLDDMEVSDEINACSVEIEVDVNGVKEPWLLMFKNETHNHPTEIEPFGGAATCIGGAIRDPLSGRSYVYQAMRISGAGDITTPIAETRAGKLPQQVISKTAAHGYSSYGNQIGLATTYVREYFHPGFVAKRMELGAVVGAAPKENVVREKPEAGDVIILLGGKTGRDGVGGATGSSKVQTVESVETAGTEVQKGNAIEERKIQRLFRNGEVTRLIKKSNDFGAGGVCVAIGELADGLEIDLDKVPLKYQGLNGTEIAISESQERMAVVLDKKDVEQFLTYAEEENLEATVVAEVTEAKRLVMSWRGKEIVNLSRAFLDTNGAHQETTVEVEMPDEKECYYKKQDEFKDAKEMWTEKLSDLNVCSKKGLVEMFDSSIGAGTVTMPFGGKTQLTPIQTMTAKLPVLEGKTELTTMMSYGFDPYLSSWSPYHGAVYAVLESVAKIVAAGGDFRKIRLTFQEYFERLGTDPKRWGKPFAALLGAYNAQKGFGIPSIGGKDSMSGSFEDIDVPPTLVSFAVDYTKASHVVTPEFKKAGNNLLRVDIPFDEYGIPDYKEAGKIYDTIHKLMRKDVIASAYALGAGGLIEAISKMSFGNMYGVKLVRDFNKEDLTKKYYGSILVEIPTEWMDEMAVLPNIFVGRVTDDPFFQVGEEEISLKEMCDVWQKPLESVFPTKTNATKHNVSQPLYRTNDIYVCKNKVAVPKVFIPVFPGTNCEYDSAKAFRRAGAEVETLVFKNQSESDILESVDAFEKAISQAQIIMFPGGFSAGDEPEGSAKFFATVFRNEKIKESVMKLLNERDGLALGICNGFQALVKLGLVPYGEIVNQTEDSPTLTMNEIGRHVSTMVYTKVVTNKSPWLRKAVLDQIYAIPASHGEGRFVASKEWIEKLFKNGQVATQYVNLNGEPTMDDRYNPNGSYYAIEGITSPDGRVLGKMAHSERIGENIAKNIYAKQDQKIFESGVEYFK